MFATYLRKGQGKSNNAYFAEAEGKWPLTRAVDVIYNATKDYYKIPKRIIRDWLKLQGNSEYHHVGKYATMCDYYETEDIINALLGDICEGYWDTNINNEPIFWGNSFLEMFE